VRPPLFRPAIGGRVEATPNEKENDHETQSTNNRKTTNREALPPSLIAYHVVERGQDKKFWTRIGACWKHEDGEGLSLHLDLFPAAGGRVVLRTPKEDTPPDDDQG